MVNIDRPVGTWKIELILDPFQNNKKKEREKDLYNRVPEKKEVRIDFENRLLLW